MPRTLRRFGLALAAVAAAYALGAALLVRSPDRFVDFPERELPLTPGALGIDYREVWLRAGPNRALVHGWWLPNGRNAQAVLLLPGTGRSKAGLVHVAAAMHAAGAAVLMIDYRGLGRSDRGPLSEASMFEDAEAAWHELRWHQPEGGRRLVYGHSLGATAALELAARHVGRGALPGRPASRGTLRRAGEDPAPQRSAPGRPRQARSDRAARDGARALRARARPQGTPAGRCRGARRRGARRCGRLPGRVRAADAGTRPGPRPPYAACGAQPGGLNR
jgi:pimeloyl-ACP methyl ester carboxylesterase